MQQQHLGLGSRAVRICIGNITQVLCIGNIIYIDQSDDDGDGADNDIAFSSYDLDSI